eukprot:4302671-Pleurochrysis_carterae.AAC.1
MRAGRTGWGDTRLWRRSPGASLAHVRVVALGRCGGTGAQRHDASAEGGGTGANTVNGAAVTCIDASRRVVRS